MPDFAPLVIKPSETAKLLNISERTRWGLTKSKIIPCVRIGSSVRYNVDSLRAWVIDQEKNSHSPTT